jgi:pyridoxamine 5'-phosphate oxidase
MAADFIQINKNYQRNSLKTVAADPLQQFQQWFEQAQKTLPNELVNAMALATVNADGQPSMRMVLLKQFNENGFVFFTNYDSRKGQDIADESKVALLFWWEQLAWQIRVEGVAEKISAEDSQQYFQSRSRDSQLAAIVSPQSCVVPDVAALESQYQELRQQYADPNQAIPCPAHWGGYLVKPHLFEFWQGGEHRLHDRFQYKLHNNQWIIVRLAP